MKKHQAVRSGMWVAAFSLMMIAIAVGSAAARPAPSATPAVVGDWNGALNTGGGSLKIVIHVAQDKDGVLTATMDSPDQSVTGIPISLITFKESSLHLEIAKYGASFDGTMNKDSSEIAGNWNQGGAVLPLTFKRAVK